MEKFIYICYQIPR